MMGMDDKQVCQWGDGYSPYAPGDQLRVREAWCHTGDHVFEVHQARMRGRYGVIYRADNDPKFPHARWWSGAVMPREFSRLTLTVTDVRVERLQDISEADAIAEGAAQSGGTYLDEHTQRWHSCTIAEFRGDWNANHKPGEQWADNPWVCAVTFDYEQRNIDSPTVING